MDNTLRTQILAALHLGDATLERQEEVLQRIEQTAQLRVALLLPDLLTPAQLEQVGKMYEQGADNRAIAQWAMTQVPVPYERLVDTTIRSVATELIETMRRIREKQAR